jgi:6-phosphogluconolactonase
MTPTRWHRVEHAEALAKEAAARILASARAAIAARSRFRIVLAGGKTPLGTYRLLRETHGDWSRWHVYYSDERCLPVTHPGRNSRAIGAAWLDHVAIPPENCHVIPAELGPTRGASDYAQVVAEVDEFDLVLLGLGADGHTASLFPGHFDPDSADDGPALAVEDAPVPPPQRVSLSPARLSRARAVMFLVDGTAKRAAIEAWRTGGVTAARSIRPPGGIDVLFAAENARATAVRLRGRSADVRTRNRLG